MSCTYTGTASSGSFSLKTTNCEAGNFYNASCLSGATRDLWLVSDVIEATVNGRDASGTQTRTFDVVVGGTRNSVGTMTAVSKFTARRP